MNKSRFYMLCVLFSGIAIILSATIFGYFQTKSGTFVQNHDAVIFGDPECSDCKHYVNEQLLPTLADANITDIRYVNYLGNGDERAVFNDFNTKNNIPLSLISKPSVSIKDKIILEGYVPKEKIIEILDTRNNITGKVLLHFDWEKPTRYRIWDLTGEIKEYDVSTPVGVYFEWLKDHPGTEPPRGQSVVDMLPLVIIGGLIDGINPCAFAVILFFVTFLYSTKAGRGEIFDVGMTYVVVIFLVYFLIGLALFETIKASGIQLFVMLLAAGAIIILGIININDSIGGAKKPLLGIPEKSKKRIRRFARKASIPTAVGLAVFVSVTEFACTGAIYLVVISLLSLAATYLQGVALLVLYNIMFVVPLLIILLLASSRKIAGEMKGWREREKRSMRLSLGIGMVLLGLWTLAMKYSPVLTIAITGLLALDLAFALVVYMKMKKKDASLPRDCAQERTR